jgi:hypothetical protein
MRVTRTKKGLYGVLALALALGFGMAACGDTPGGNGGAGTGGIGNGGHSVSIPTIDVGAIPVPTDFFDEAGGASAITATTPATTVEEVAQELFLLAVEVEHEFENTMFKAFESWIYDKDTIGTHRVEDFLTLSDINALSSKGIIPPWAGAITISFSGGVFRMHTNPAIGFDFNISTYDIAGRARIAYDNINRQTSTHYIEETAYSRTYAFAFIIEHDSEDFAGKVIISTRYAYTFRENRNTGAEEYIDNYSQALFRAVFYDQEGNHTRTFQLTGEDALDFMWYSTPEFEPTAQRHSLEGARSGRSARSRTR